MLAVAVDFAHEFRQGHVSEPGDLLHAVPECLFKAHAGLVTRDNDRTFHHGRLHDASSLSILCWSSRSLACLVRFASAARSGLVRPNRARLVSACRSDRSRSLRFLKRFRLTKSPIVTPSGDHFFKERVQRKIAIRYFGACGGRLDHHCRKTPVCAYGQHQKACSLLREHEIGALPQPSKRRSSLDPSLQSLRSISISAYRNYP